MSKNKAAVLYGYGINCDGESAHVLRTVGIDVTRVHIHELIENPAMLQDFAMLMFPGGFSFGDDLGSGKVLANKFKFRLKDDMMDFVKEEKLVLGVCNGFQIITKMGLLPYSDFKQKATLMSNDSGKFEDRWVHLKVNKASHCIFTKGITGMMMPIRHGEGKFVTDSVTLDELASRDMITMQYCNEREDTSAGYPYNPNGSLMNIAGICNEKGNVFGLMPHPEAYNAVFNNPYWAKAKASKTGIQEWKGSGMEVFENAARYLNERF